MSGACVGKKIIFVYKCLEKRRFSHAPNAPARIVLARTAAVRHAPVRTELLGALVAAKANRAVALKGADAISVAANPTIETQRRVRVRLLCGHAVVPAYCAAGAT